MEKILLDYTNWLLDMDRLKVTTQLPPFENSEMMVNYYLKSKNNSIQSFCKCINGPTGRTVTEDFEHQICDTCGKIVS